jgi:AcrR family transcriptional regulator
MDGYQRRKQHKKESIRKAALELFTAYGIKKASIAEIAKKAGANPVTIYNHFGDKDSLVRDVIKGLIMDHWKEVREILESDQQFMAKLEQIVSNKIEMASLYSSEFIQTAVSEDMGIKEMVELLYKNEVNPLLTKFIQDGQKSGSIRRDLSIDTISIYIDMFTSVARTHPELFSNQAQLLKFTREIWTLFLYGLAGKLS